VDQYIQVVVDLWLDQVEQFGLAKILVVALQ